jgi:hypothetical protein
LSSQNARLWYVYESRVAFFIGFDVETPWAANRLWEDMFHEWLQKAADAGDTVAMYSLGWLYEHGQGVAPGDAQAFAWYRKAADAGHSGAMVKLAGIYEDGLGVAQDDAQAVAWYRKSAYAMAGLGLM